MALERGFDDLARAGAALAHDEGHALEHVGLEGAVFGLGREGVIGSGDQDHAVVSEDLDVQALGDGCALREAEVELAAEHELFHARRVADLELQLDVGMGRVELAKHCGHDVAADGGAGRQRQVTEVETEQRLERRLGCLFFLEQAAGVPAQDLTRGGQAYAARPAFEEGNAEVRLELGELF